MNHLPVADSTSLNLNGRPCTGLGDIRPAQLATTGPRPGYRQSVTTGSQGPSPAQSRVDRSEGLGWIGLLVVFLALMAGAQLRRLIMTASHGQSRWLLSAWDLLFMVLAAAGLSLLASSRSASRVLGAVALFWGAFGVLDPVALLRLSKLQAPGQTVDQVTRFGQDLTIIGAVAVVGAVLVGGSFTPPQSTKFGYLGLPLLAAAVIGWWFAAGSRWNLVIRGRLQEQSQAAAVLVAAAVVGLAVWLTARMPWAIVATGIGAGAVELALLTQPYFLQHAELMVLAGTAAMGLVTAVLIGAGLARVRQERRRAPSQPPPWIWPGPESVGGPVNWSGHPPEPGH